MYYNYYDDYTYVASRPLAPSRHVNDYPPDADPANPKLAVPLEELKKHIGLFGGDGQSDPTPTTDATLRLYARWAEEKVSEWENRPVGAEDVADYYTRLANRMELSSRSTVDGTPTIEVILAGETTLTTLSTSDWMLDDTTSPAQLVVDNIPDLSDRHRYPVRVSYQVSPHSRKRRDSMNATIVFLVQHKWNQQERNEPVDDKMVTQILMANLGPPRLG